MKDGGGEYTAVRGHCPKNNKTDNAVKEKYGPALSLKR
jgi:hypothetical protein